MAKKSLAGLCSATAVATKRRPTKVVRKLATPFARDAIEGLAGGLDVFGFTKGQFSFVDLIDAVLDLTGPSTVTVATWTAAAADASFLGDWCRQGRIKQFRLLIDYSFLTRRGGAEAVDAVIQNFGPDGRRCVKSGSRPRCCSPRKSRNGLTMRAIAAIPWPRWRSASPPGRCAGRSAITRRPRLAQRVHRG
ncbi:MAG: hypothetical protein O7D91_13685 [Planctomycetota bacterium]|nr:hypothetical protein [Planctomycetota bacterium]